MPNWCNNSLKVLGARELVEDFCKTQFSIEEDTKELVLDFGKLIPEPTFDNADEQNLYDGAGWYDWRINNWGVKWNADMNYIDKCIGTDEYGEITISFDTPWTTPTAWFEKLCEKYPTLDMELAYHEAGMGFRGFFTNVKGVAQDNSWDMTKEDYEELGYGDDEEDTFDNEEDRPESVFHDMDKVVEQLDNDFNEALGREK